jgi:hypothetical protein
MLTLLGIYLLHKLTAIERTKIPSLVGSQQLALESIEQQVVELIDIHLIVYIDWRVVVCLDRLNDMAWIDETLVRVLHEGEDLLCLEKKTGSSGNCRSENKFTELGIHEELGEERVEIAGVRQVSQTNVSAS